MDANKTELFFDLPDEAATSALAEDLAVVLIRGDVVALAGDLGAGKTTFARSLLRAFVDDVGLEVPSPTFTLVQTYSGGRLPVAHFDFYRLSLADELDEIGFDDAVTDGAVIIEWPERALSRLPTERIDLSFEIAGTGRKVAIVGQGSLIARFRRSRAIRVFLDRAKWRHAARRHLQGDASSRTYERIRWSDRKAVLMDWPPRSLDVAADNNQGIYRARDVRSFIAVDAALRDCGLSAPELYADDNEAGLLLMEDLGTKGVVAGVSPIAERYSVAISALAQIHMHRRTAELPLPDGTLHHLPAYGSAALAAELDLYLDWYIPHLTGEPPNPAARAEFSELWAPLFDRLDRAERSWVLLDVHSPNLLWLPDRDGIRRIGFLDFQDAMIGPTAYDVASLAQDARITVPPDLERDLVDHYVNKRKMGEGDFDAKRFAEAYVILGVQRATRILGVFARLADHAGKRGYLQHIPRVRGYLARSLAHPVMSRLSLWYERHRLL